VLAGVTTAGRRVWPALGTGFLLAIAISACGSGGEETTVHTIPKAMFMKKANAICKKGGKEINAVYGKYAGKALPKGVDGEEFMNKVAERIVIPVRRKELKELRAVGLPRGDERRVEKILAAIEEGIERGEEDRRSLRAGGSKYAFWKALNLEGDYGLTSCSLG
jgi:hypothetical protein